MSIIQAWKCDETQNIFEHKFQYTAHLKKLTAGKTRAAQLLARQQQQTLTFAEMRNQVTDRETLANFIKVNWQTFVDNFNDSVNPPNPGRKKFSPVLKSLRIDLMPIQMVKCNHSAPQGCDTNWAETNNRPTHYWGISGRWQVQYTGHHSTAAIYDIFRNTGIHTGSGSGSTCEKNVNRFSGDLTLWLQDWPALQQLSVLKIMCPEIQVTEII